MSVNKLQEYQKLVSWLPKIAASKNQINKPFESDCEILKISDSQYLTLTVDSVDEEILSKLITDPETLGWICIVASCSDLAASCSNPLGILLCSSWGMKWNDHEKKLFGKGVVECLEAHNISLLGGDTGSSYLSVFSSTGVGLCSNPKTRMGSKQGDLIVLSSSLKYGARIALEFIEEERLSKEIESSYRPIAPIQTSLKISHLINAAMDTSDGLFRTIDTLCELSNLNCTLNLSAEFYSEETRTLFKKYSKPIELASFFEVAEYSVVYSISKENWPKAKELVPDLKIIGEFQGSETSSTFNRKIFRDILDSEPGNYRKKMEFLIDAYKRKT